MIRFTQYLYIYRKNDANEQKKLAGIPPHARHNCIDILRRKKRSFLNRNYN